MMFAVSGTQQDSIIHRNNQYSGLYQLQETPIEFSNFPPSPKTPVEFESIPFTHPKGNIQTDIQITQNLLQTLNHKYPYLNTQKQPFQTIPKNKNNFEAKEKQSKIDPHISNQFISTLLYPYFTDNENTDEYPPHPFYPSQNVSYSTNQQLSNRNINKSLIQQQLPNLQNDQFNHKYQSTKEYNSLFTPLNTHQSSFQDYKHPSIIPTSNITSNTNTNIKPRSSSLELWKQSHNQQYNILNEQKSSLTNASFHQNLLLTPKTKLQSILNQQTSSYQLFDTYRQAKEQQSNEIEIKSKNIEIDYIKWKQQFQSKQTNAQFELEQIKQQTQEKERFHQLEKEKRRRNWRNRINLTNGDQKKEEYDMNGNNIDQYIEKQKYEEYQQMQQSKEYEQYKQIQQELQDKQKEKKEQTNNIISIDNSQTNNYNQIQSQLSEQQNQTQQLQLSQLSEQMEILNNSQKDDLIHKTSGEETQIQNSSQKLENSEIILNSPEQSEFNHLYQIDDNNINQQIQQEQEQLIDKQIQKEQKLNLIEQIKQQDIQINQKQYEYNETKKEINKLNLELQQLNNQLTIQKFDNNEQKKDFNNIINYGKYLQNAQNSLLYTKQPMLVMKYPRKGKAEKRWIFIIETTQKGKYAKDQQRIIDIMNRTQERQQKQVPINPEIMKNNLKQSQLYQFQQLSENSLRNKQEKQNLRENEQNSKEKENEQQNKSEQDYDKDEQDLNRSFDETTEINTLRKELFNKQQKLINIQQDIAKLDQNMKISENNKQQIQQDQARLLNEHTWMNDKIIQLTQQYNQIPRLITEQLFLCWSDSNKQPRIQLPQINNSFSQTKLPQMSEVEEGFRRINNINNNAEGQDQQQLQIITQSQQLQTSSPQRTENNQSYEYGDKITKLPDKHFLLSEAIKIVFGQDSYLFRQQWDQERKLKDEQMIRFIRCRNNKQTQSLISKASESHDNNNTILDGYQIIKSSSQSPIKETQISQSNSPIQSTTITSQNQNQNIRNQPTVTITSSSIKQTQSSVAPSISHQIIQPSLRMTTIISPQRIQKMNETVSTALVTGTIDPSAFKQSQQQQTQSQSSYQTPLRQIRQRRSTSPEQQFQIQSTPNQQQRNKDDDNISLYSQSQITSNKRISFSNLPITPVTATLSNKYNHPPQLNTQQQKDEERSFSITFKGINRLKQSQRQEIEIDKQLDQYENEEVAFIAKTEDECLKWVQALSGLTGLQVDCSDFITEELRKQLPFEYLNPLTFEQESDDIS